MDELKQRLANKENGADLGEPQCSNKIENPQVAAQQPITHYTAAQSEAVQQPLTKSIVSAQPENLKAHPENEEEQWTPVAPNRIARRISSKGASSEGSGTAGRILVDGIGKKAIPFTVEELNRDGNPQIPSSQ
ncbi:unnamed protein product [Amaranthus hypochondriacus]